MRRFTCLVVLSALGCGFSDPGVDSYARDAAPTLDATDATTDADAADGGDAANDTTNETAPPDVGPPPCGGADLSSDPANCGTCGVVCGGKCALGRCVVTLIADSYPYSITTDDTFVYYGTTAGQVKRVEKDGSAKTLLAVSDPFPAHLVIGAGTLFWVDQTIHGVPTAGGAMTTIPNQAYSALAVGATDLYWGRQDLVRRKPYGSPEVTDYELVGYGLYGVVVDASRVYFTATSPTGRGVFSMPLFGGPPLTKYADSAGASYIVASPSRIYWGTEMGQVLSIDKSGGPVMLHAFGSSPIRGLRIDATNVYWLWEKDQTIARAPLLGTTVTTLATKSGANDFAVDSTSVYWASFVGISKLTPK